MLPLEVIIALPIPFLVAQLVVLTYLLLPLLHLLPRPGPLLEGLIALIPHPRRSRNLPREFFNLPPRPESPIGSTKSATSADVGVGAALGVRGKVLLIMLGQACLSLVAGWAYLAQTPSGRAGGVLLSLSTIPIPCTVAVIALFSALRKPHHMARHELPLLRSAIFGSGGVTHSTIVPRILPCALALSATLTIIAVALPSAGIYLLTINALLISISVASALSSSGKTSRSQRGRIRLASPSPEPYRPTRGVQLSEEDIRGFKDSDSMVSSPSRPPTPASAFSYSPSVHSAHSTTPTSYRTAHSQHSTQHDTPNSWLTEYTSTPSTMHTWDYTKSPTPTLPTPSSAVTRPRSPSASPAFPEMSSPHTVIRGSATTVGDSTMYTLPLSTPASAGGSILAGYSPDPFQPMPRGFESLTSFPLTPEQLASRASLVERVNGESALTFVPAPTADPAQDQGDGRESTWTLESYHSRELAYQTPKSQVRDRDHRAPPPPPMPFAMPLPPTPTVARSETAWERNTESRLGKDSTELLIGLDPEWALIDLTGDDDALEGWASGGRGVGLLTLVGTLISFALAAPLLAAGITQTSETLYLVSLLIPSVILLLSAHLLRPRGLPVLAKPQNKSKKGSKTSTSTHQSLALRSESQLSLPATISPKLTPPVRKPPANVPLGEKWNSLLEPKPSISSFGYQAPTLSGKGHRRHTVYGALALGARDEAAEDNMRKTLARRSVDIWLEAGHAKPPGNLLERAAEMIKPTPALRIMDSERSAPAAGVLTRLRGGVVSMLPKRFSLVREEAGGVAMTPRRDSRYADAEADGDEPRSPITIHITSPSKYERRRSGLTRELSAEPSFDEGGSGDVEVDGEIQTATRARMSASPTYFFGRDRSASDAVDAELDWLQSAILPQLVPGIKLPRNSVADPSEQFADAETPRIDRRRRRSSVSGTPHRRDSSADFDPNQFTTSTPRSGTTSSRRELRHKHSFSLPLIDKASFSDLRSQMRQAGLPRQHNWSIYADAPAGPIDFSAPPGGYETGSGDGGGGGGIDLPAFPVDLSLIHFPATPALSTVDEANESRLSDNMRHLAQLTLSAEAHFSHSPASLFPSPSSRRDLHHPQPSTDSALVGQDSFVSEDEAMAREMEQVLSMDTPTRAEFVISPTFSEATTASNRTSWSRATGFRPLSRASSAGSVWEGKLDKKVSASSLASRRSAASAAPSEPEAASAEMTSLDGSAVPPVPELPASMRRPASQIFAHPFPVHNAAASVPLFISALPSLPPTPVPSSLDFIPPTGPQQAFRTFMTCQSAETLASESTENGTPSSMRHTWRAAGDQPELTAEMREKAAAARQSILADTPAPTSTAASSVGRVEQEVQAIETRSKAFGESSPPSPEKASRKGLRPLKLLANRPPSVIGPSAATNLPVEAAAYPQAKRASDRAAAPATPSRKKTSKGSRTNENAPMAAVQTPGSRKKTGKLSKGSTGPAGLGPSGLRA